MFQHDPLLIKKCVLQQYFIDPNIIEIGIDEVGRGPLFGRVYAAAVILPKDTISFDHFRMKDSKKFTSKKKLIETSEYIKHNACAWSIQWEDELVIDEINILQASQQAMHKCIKEIIGNKIIEQLNDPSTVLLVDGTYFNAYTVYNQEKQKIQQINHICIKGGDDKYSSIAAASIIAKVARDEYIEDLCLKNPELVEHYSIDTNKGYGSKKHLDGIKQYGITQWHRKTFGICKEF